MEDRYRRTTRKDDRDSKLGMMIMIVGAVAIHVALGNFGYRWVRGQSAPVFPATDLNVRTVSAPGQYLSPLVRKSLAPEEQMTGKLHWSHRDGMSAKSDQLDNWTTGNARVATPTRRQSMRMGRR